MPVTVFQHVKSVQELLYIRKIFYLNQNKILSMDRTTFLLLSSECIKVHFLIFSSVYIILAHASNEDIYLKLPVLKLLLFCDLVSQEDQQIP